MSVLSCLKDALTCFTSVFLILLSVSPLFASGSNDHPHSAKMEMPMASHAHKSWQEVPSPYAGKLYKNWNNRDSIALGGKLYAENCLGCHGKDGKGKGDMAAGLEHPPADLTSHFHCLTGQGDDYLFWRISEGGEVEPFMAMRSAMPSFKDFVSERERWAILSYVHSTFHDPGSETCQGKKKTDDHKRATHH